MERGRSLIMLLRRTDFILSLDSPYFRRARQGMLATPVGVGLRKMKEMYLYTYHLKRGRSRGVLAGHRSIMEMCIGSLVSMRKKVILIMNLSVKRILRLSLNTSPQL